MGLFPENPFALVLCCTGHLALVFAEWSIGHTLLSVKDAALGARSAERPRGSLKNQRSIDPDPRYIPWSMPSRDPVMRRPKYGAMITYRIIRSTSKHGRGDHDIPESRQR